MLKPQHLGYAISKLRLSWTFLPAGPSFWQLPTNRSSSRIPDRYLQRAIAVFPDEKSKFFYIMVSLLSEACP
jgi:hypothetical protein